MCYDRWRKGGNRLALGWSGYQQGVIVLANVGITPRREAGVVYGPWVSGGYVCEVCSVS